MRKSDNHIALVDVNIFPTLQSKKSDVEVLGGAHLDKKSFFLPFVVILETFRKHDDARNAIRTSQISEVFQPLHQSVFHFSTLCGRYRPISAGLEINCFAIVWKTRALDYILLISCFYHS